MALLKTEDLGRTIGGRQILEGIDLEVERGEIFSLIGPTGAGKTTLIRLLNLLDRPSSGRIIFDGRDVSRSNRRRLDARRRMAHVQQKPIVFSMSVYDNVACGLQWRGEKNLRQKTEAALDRVGMLDRRDRDARTLSGGETQRIALARALVTDPLLLFLDEPTANLDPVSVSRTEEILNRVISDQKTTVLMATHDMRQGHRLATRTGALIDGRLQQVGSPDEIYHSPVNRMVAELVGIENILTGTILDKDGSLATIDVSGRTLQAVTDALIGDPVDVLIKPVDITFTLSKDPSSARNILEGKISRMTSEGTLLRIVVDCGFPLLGVLTVNSADELRLAIGKPIFANFKATAIHILKRWK
jgi:tungstate transport system ATP-binding protein